MPNEELHLTAAAGELRRSAEEVVVPNWPRDIQTLSAGGLSQVLTSARLVGIHCWASWNGYDHEFAARLRLTVEKFSPQIDVYALDIEDPENVGLVASWGILNVPAFVVFREGTRVSTFWMQRESVADFQKRVEDWLAEAAA